MQTPRMLSSVRTAAPVLTDAGVGVGVLLDNGEHIGADAVAWTTGFRVPARRPPAGAGRPGRRAGGGRAPVGGRARPGGPGVARGAPLTGQRPGRRAGGGSLFRPVPGSRALSNSSTVPSTGCQNTPGRRRVPAALSFRNRSA
jgi:hypothetical protein